MRLNSRCSWLQSATAGGYVLLDMMLLRVFRRESFCRNGVKVLITTASGCLILSTALPAQAQQATAVLFQNVRIFDGKSDVLSAASSVLIQDNKIEKISRAAMPADGAQLINGGGRVLMPGLIDACALACDVGAIEPY
jgi:hypothetical protein